MTTFVRTPPMLRPPFAAFFLATARSERRLLTSSAASLACESAAATPLLSAELTTWTPGLITTYGLRWLQSLVIARKAAQWARPPRRTEAPSSSSPLRTGANQSFSDDVGYPTVLLQSPVDPDMRADSEHELMLRSESPSHTRRSRLEVVMVTGGGYTLRF